MNLVAIFRKEAFIVMAQYRTTLVECLLLPLSSSILAQSTVCNCVHPNLFYVGQLSLALCHTLSCAGCTPQRNPSQNTATYAIMLLHHLMQYVNLCKMASSSVIGYNIEAEARDPDFG